MMCQRCNQRQATVHLQQTIDGKSTDTHFCQECATIQTNEAASFDNFFHGFLESFLTQQIKAKALQSGLDTTVLCPVCGVTYQKFKDTGRLGCSTCYDTFRTELGAIFKSIQASNTHQGKMPKRAWAAHAQNVALAKLKESLAMAIAQEAFEDAAALRDQIKSMQKAVAQ